MELVLTMISMRRERKDRYWQCVCVEEITRIRGIGTDRRDRRDRKGSEGSLPIVRDRKRSEGSVGEGSDTGNNTGIREFENSQFSNSQEIGNLKIEN